MPRCSQKSGLLLKTRSGYVQRSPLIGIVNGCRYPAHLDEGARREWQAPRTQ